MIKGEVKSAIKENEDKLGSLIETVQQLDSEADYESCFQNLEVSWSGDICLLLVGGNYSISPHLYIYFFFLF